MHYDFKIGWCPYCGQGWVEIKKDIMLNNLLVTCSECDTVWDTPIDFIENNPHRNFRPGSKLEKPTIGELSEKEWTRFIVEDT